MINNRQGGRRRGRGGQRAPNSGGQQGNRQDNRQRGNAAQLLEKYKSMARDSQLAGDRVQTEYYLQYADHYFRLLGETRARFEEQRPQRSDGMDDDDGDDGGFEADGGDDDSGQDRDDRQDRSDRNDRQERSDRAERSPRQSRPRRDESRDESRDEDSDRPAQRSSNGNTSRDDGDERPAPRSRAPRPARVSARANGGETMPFDALPPAIGAEPVAASAGKASDDGSSGDGEDKPQPRRRTRAARPADDEAAPAA